MRSKTTERQFVAAAGMAGLYYAVSRVNLELVQDHAGVAAIWPASGLALAAFILLGRPYWAALAVGVFAGNLVAQFDVRGVGLLGVGLAFANAAEPLIAAYVMRVMAIRTHKELGEISDVLGLLLGALAGAGAAALFGAAMLTLVTDATFWVTASQWMAADALGMVVFAPLIVELRRPQERPGTRLETTLAMVTATGLIVVLFGAPQSSLPVFLHWPFFLFPALMWVAMRTSKRDVMVILGLLGIAAGIGTQHGHGPFVHSGLDLLESILVAQAFIASMVGCTLMVAATTRRRRFAECRVDQERDQLSAERERFAGVLRAATEISVIATDLNGTITVFNEGAEHMLGWRAEELIGKHTPEVIHDAREVVARAAELGVDPGFDVFVPRARQGQAETRQWTYVRKDGSKLQVSLSVTAMKGPDGEVTGFIGIAQDLSERLATEALLREREAHHRLVLANLPDTMVALYGVDGTCELLEGQLLQRFGRHPAEYLGEHVADSLPSDAGPQFAAAVDAALHGEPRTLEYRTQDAQYDLEFSTVPVREDDGEIRHAMVITQDVTAQRRAEAERRSAEQRFTKAFEHGPVAMAVVGLDGKPTKVNSAFLDLTGRSAEAITGGTVDALVQPGDRAEVVEAGRRLLDGQLETWRGQLGMLSSTGARVQCAVYATLLRDAGGTPQHYLAHVVDITERIHLERRLRYMADHDSLTGLLNRRRFELDLAEHLDRAEQPKQGRAGALILLDVDHFKRVNDTLGHAAGDDLLVALSGALRARLRDDDLVARLGGDEFAVLLPGVTRSQAEQVAGEILASARHGQPNSALGRQVVTCSIGIAMCADHDGVEKLMRAADLAMYETKRSGRDGYVLADPQHADRRHRRG